MQKTTDAPAKKNCKLIKKQLPRQQKTTAELSKNNYRGQKQLSKCHKTTAKMPKDNCRIDCWIVKRQMPKSWAVRQLKFNLLCASGSTKQLPNRQKTTAEENNNCRTSKHNFRKIKKQMPNRQTTTAEQ